MNLVPLLAEVTTTVTESVSEIGPYLEKFPEWGLQAILYCSAASLVLTVYIFLRQKKIAQNQVDLAKILEQLIP